MAAPFILTSFAKGEIAPSLYGHVDLAAFHTAASTARNMFVGFRGGLYSRAGTAFVGQSKQRPDLGQLPPRLINWDFNVNQEDEVEFGDGYVRLIFQGGQVTETPITVTGIAQSSPAIVTTAISHEYSAGDWIELENIFGSLGLYLNETFTVGSVPTLNTFTLADLDGNPINSTGFPAFVSGSVPSVAARIYTIASPYAAVDLPYLKWAQSADVMTLTCVNPIRDVEYAPYDLKRFAPTNWTLTPTQFGTDGVAPANATVTATTQPNSGSTPPTLPAAYAYEVTAIDSVTGQESGPSPVANVTNGVDMAETAGSNVVDWSQSPLAAYYNIYRAPTSYNTDPGSPTVALPVPAGALFGFVGSSYGNQFVDSNIVPNFSVSPPQDAKPFVPGQILQIGMLASSSDWTHATPVITTSTGSGLVAEAAIVGGQIISWIILNPGQFYKPTDTVSFSGDGSSALGVLNVGPQSGTFPGVVSYFQERRVFAQTLNAPDEYWMSKPGQFNNFDVSNPVQDSDALSGTPWSEKVDGIQWMLTMPLGLLTFTASGVWQVGPSGTFASSPAAITPSNQLAAPQSSIGSSPTVPPIRVNWDVLYLEYMNSSILDLSYQIFFNIYAGTDVSWASSHLVQNYQILQWWYSRTPNRLIWAVRNDGVMLSLTYVKEQEVVGWARHDTQGQFRSVTGGTEFPIDAVYVVVERPVAAGGTRYFIERFDNRVWQTIEDPWCVDAAVATPLTTFPGATLHASSPTGNVTFSTGTGIFNSGQVGWTLRMGGGIATLTSAGAGGGAVATGTWILPCQQLLPNDPAGSALPQPGGAWSIAPNVTQVGGLRHLAGRQVVGLADGVPIGINPNLQSTYPNLLALSFGLLVPDQNGIVTLPFPASNVRLGLGFTAQAQSVYLDTGQPTIQGRRKNIYAVTARCEASSLCQAGANQRDASATSPPPLFATWTKLAQGSSANVEPIPPAAYTTPGGSTAQPLFTGDVRINIPSEWAKPGQVAAQQALPLPLNLLAFIPEPQAGDTPDTEIRPRQPAQQNGRRGA